MAHLDKLEAEKQLKEAIVALVREQDGWPQEAVARAIRVLVNETLRQELGVHYGMSF